MASDSDVITATISRSREISGISRSRIYEMLAAGELEWVHVGARRLILIDSYRRLLVKLKAADAEAGNRRHPADPAHAGRGDPCRDTTAPPQRALPPGPI